MLAGVLVAFCQLDTNEFSGKRESGVRNDLHQVGLWVCLWGIFLVNNDVGGGRAQPPHCGWCCPWAGGPGLYKGADQ